jgi:tripartite-type tricarboxylate transporter receptor subunit TctC
MIVAGGGAMSVLNYPSFVLALAVAFACGSAQAQADYPGKPVRLVVGFTAGGPTDLPARAVADKLGALLGQRVVVENKAGAGGQLATQDVLSKPADGYNLLLCTHFESINQALYKNLTWTLRDIAPISQISRYYYGVAASSELPAKDWKSFIAYAKANPGKVNYGSVGRGSAQEILALELGKLTGIELTGISYKGATQVIPDLLAGRVHLFVSPTLSVLPHHQAGKLRILAVTSPERLAAAPEVPTVKEQGVDFVRFGWLGICAPAGTPQPVIATLNRHIANIVSSDRDYRQLIEKAGSIPLSSTPGELAAILRETYEQTAAAVREFGLQRD